jgi:hypothetical protein
MSFNVFLTYSMDPDEQSLVWRLQTLATAQGINFYVPMREGSQSSIRNEVRAAIDRADCVMAIITARAKAAVQNELNYALSVNKVIVPIVQQGVGDPNYFRKFPRVFWFSPFEPPGRVEGEVVEFLKTQKLNKEGKQALGAVVAIGVGMLLLYALSRE